MPNIEACNIRIEALENTARINSDTISKLVRVQDRQQTILENQKEIMKDTADQRDLKELRKDIEQLSVNVSEFREQVDCRFTRLENRIENIEKKPNVRLEHAITVAITAIVTLLITYVFTNFAGS